MEKNNYPEPDNFYRPTAEAWVCPKCKTQLYTKDAIESHIEMGCREDILKEIEIQSAPKNYVKEIARRRNRTFSSTAIALLVKVAKDKEIDYRSLTIKVIKVFASKETISLSDLLGNNKWRNDKK